jgi:flagellar hook-associated protein 2
MAGIQMGGLASGMDTEGVIAQLMQLEAQPGIRMAQQKKVSESREQTLKDILSRVKNLQTAAKDLKSVTTWSDTQSVESSDSTKITASRVGGAGPGAYSVSVSRLAAGDQWSYAFKAPTADTSFTITNTKTGVGQVVNLTSGMTIDDAVGVINSNTDSKVYAVNVAGRMVLSSRDTGGDAAFSVSPVSAADTLDTPTHLRTAIDAEYSLDGGATKKTSASNVVKDGVPGIEFTIKSLVPDASPVMLNVSNPGVDNTAVKNKVKAFVEQYNSTIDLIRSELTEQKVKDPKTDADRAKGVLYNDSMLNGLLTRLRGSIGAAFDTGDSKVDQLGEIGVSTGKSTGSAASPDALAGKLVFDDAKFSAALAASPVAVRRLLGATAGVEGIGSRLDTMLDAVAKKDGDIDGRITSADKEQKRFDDQMAALDKRIDAKTAMLRAQFTAMESAISRSQSQQSWLAGQLR